jgi:hypothetical protein
LSEKRRRFFFSKEASVSDVINDVVGMLIGLGPIGAALLWCDLQDRFRRRANRVGADIRATANRALGGESMLAVRVRPAIAWRPGRVHLSTPGGYEFLIASVSGAVVNRLPHNYELVVHRG